jgi:hypothetical protein
MASKKAALGGLESDGGAAQGYLSTQQVARGCAMTVWRRLVHCGPGGVSAAEKSTSLAGTHLRCAVRCPIDGARARRAGRVAGAGDGRGGCRAGHWWRRGQRVPVLDDAGGYGEAVGGVVQVGGGGSGGEARGGSAADDGSGAVKCVCV